MNDRNFPQKIQRQQLGQVENHPMTLNQEFSKIQLPQKSLKDACFIQNRRFSFFESPILPYNSFQEKLLSQNPENENFLQRNEQDKKFITSNAFQKIKPDKIYFGPNHMFSWFSCLGQIKDSSDFETFVFHPCNLKNQWKKNTNMPKFIVRVFLKYFYSMNPEKFNNRLKDNHKKVKNQIRKIKTNNYRINHIAMLLGQATNHYRINRKLMWKILREKMSQEIIDNESITENKKSYMMACKVYALRCRSVSLAKRLQIL